MGHEPQGVPERSPELAPASLLSVEPDPAIQEDWPGDGGKPAGSSTGRNSSSNIRVDVGLLDKLMNLVGELVLRGTRSSSEAMHIRTPRSSGYLATAGLITTELQEGVMKTRMQPIENIWSKFPRVVRDLALACGKQVRVELEGSETELDREHHRGDQGSADSTGSKCRRPRHRASRGAAPPRQGRHGMLADARFHESGQVNIEIADDGAGIDVPGSTASRDGTRIDVP